MAVCEWCHHEMDTAISCTIGALHRKGRSVELPPYGSEPGWPSRSDRCGDCGVVLGGWHHPGCDLQLCPQCGDQLLSCDCCFDEDESPMGSSITEPLGVDGNGLLTERTWLGDTEVIIHRDDVPPSDITVIDGIRCTTALRTVIDLAPELSTSHLHEIVDDALARGMFTVADAWRRLAEPDMATRRGAELLRQVLPPAAM
jgi:hypothetical protein